MASRENIFDAEEGLGLTLAYRTEYRGKQVVNEGYICFNGYPQNPSDFDNDGILARGATPILLAQELKKQYSAHAEPEMEGLVRVQNASGILMQFSPNGKRKTYSDRPLKDSELESFIREIS